MVDVSLTTKTTHLSWWMHSMWAQRCFPCTFFLSQSSSASVYLLWSFSCWAGCWCFPNLKDRTGHLAQQSKHLHLNWECLDSSPSSTCDSSFLPMCLRTWSPATHVEDAGGAPDTELQPEPAPVDESYLSVFIPPPSKKTAKGKSGFKQTGWNHAEWA